MRVNQRVFYPMGAIVEVEGNEAKRLVSLGFAEFVEDKAPAETTETAEATEGPKTTKRTTKKK